MGKKGTDKHHAAHNAIYESHGSARFAETVTTYLEEYGLPEDWSTLSLLEILAMTTKNEDLREFVEDALRAL